LLHDNEYEVGRRGTTRQRRRLGTEFESVGFEVVAAG